MKPSSPQRRLILRESDVELRKLERLARMNDPEALERYLATQKRTRRSELTGDPIARQVGRLKEVPERYQHSPLDLDDYLFVEITWDPNRMDQNQAVNIARRLVWERGYYAGHFEFIQSYDVLGWVVGYLEVSPELFNTELAEYSSVDWEDDETGVGIHIDRQP